jgi:hypothetical protein
MRRQGAKRRPVWFWAGALLLGALLVDLLPHLRLVIGAAELLLAPLLLWLVFFAFAVVLGRRFRTETRDALHEEETACKQRLGELRARAEQIEVTLRDLRDLDLPPSDTTRAEWADVELMETLQDVRRGMARERAALFSLEATRWLGQIEPLVRQTGELDARAVADWTGRIVAIRAQGVEILARLRMDLEAVGTPSGRTAETLIRESLEELDLLRAELLARRAKLLGAATAEELDAVESDAALDRLRTTLEHARARREVRSWLSRG